MADLDLLRLISGAMAIVQNDLSAKLEREAIAPLTRERDIACARVRELEAECATLRRRLLVVSEAYVQGAPDVMQ